MRTLFLFGLLLVAACGSSTPPADGGLDATLSDGSAGKDGSSGVEGGAGPCDGGACTFGFKCCGNTCVNDRNDPKNCGGCGTTCGGMTPMCSNGTCTGSKCMPACATNQVCCEVEGPGPSMGPKCYDGDTCPVGCPQCQ
jgi:hypothetical protein